MLKHQSHISMWCTCRHELCVIPVFSTCNCLTVTVLSYASLFLLNFNSILHIFFFVLSDIPMPLLQVFTWSLLNSPCVKMCYINKFTYMLKYEPSPDSCYYFFFQRLSFLCRPAKVPAWQRRIMGDNQTPA